MRTYLVLVIFMLMVIAGCSNKPVEPLQPEKMPPLPPGMQRFTGISDDRCENEAEAYKQAWERAMEQAAQFASTRVVSKIVDWARQETRQMVLEKSVMGIQDIQTLFESEAKLNTNVMLSQVYESQYYRQQNKDGTWKARIVVLADEEKLFRDARKALAKLEGDLESARSNAECAVRILKAQVRDGMRNMDTQTLLPQKLDLLAKAMEPYKQLQVTEISIQKARQAYASGDGVLALVTYQEIPECKEDVAPNDSPVPNVQHIYQQAWDSINDAARMLESAQKRMEARELMSAQKLMDEFYQRMGDATGPFTHIETGVTLSLSSLPSLLKKQLDTLQQETQQAAQRAESDLTGGDILKAMQAWHEALEANRDNLEAQQRLDEAIRMFATAKLEAKPGELIISSHIAIKENLRLNLLNNSEVLPMPIAFRFEENSVEAEMVTDLLNNVSSNGNLTINKIRQSPSNTNKLHLLATPAPQALTSLDEALIARLQSALENHIISIPITLKPPSLAVMLNLTSSDLSQEQMSQFRRSLKDKLSQKKYDIVEKADVNTMEVRGDIRMNSAPVGSIVTLNLSINLAFWHDNRALAEDISISSGAQMDISADDALAAAQRIVIQKCVAEIEKQMSKALGK